MEFAFFVLRVYILTGTENQPDVSSGQGDTENHP